MIFRGKPDSTNRQAADWLARLHADDRSKADEAGFSRWVAADPRNAETFERTSAIWDSLGGLAQEPRAPSPALSRRMVLAGTAVVAVTGAATLGWQEAGAVEYETAVGEQRRVVLGDGSRVILDTATSIRFVAETDLRTLLLIAGRIDVEIAADPRPFVIDAGRRRALSRAARLDVRRDGDAIALTTLAGRARISAVGHPAVVDIGVGERVSVAQDHGYQMDRPELGDLTAWQAGRLAFRDEPLATAVAEMNRYSQRPLVISDPEAGRLRVSGVYRVGDPEAFAQSLAVLLSIRVRATPDSVSISSVS
ncbi:FecR family protein [Blastomonas aquatica]|uniref:Iron dicitrate transporter FecR n=1 Tax=Blastomonas aquatica TaxID=1510276 RepID=A0ABQ1J231_9SPHN|nr:FecR domain-containing protein [Blastomonas aquatica]GGB56759.1 iron dicitrate transporter FecR [Blastomonas aquatica]